MSAELQSTLRYQAERVASGTLSPADLARLAGEFLAIERQSKLPPTKGKVIRLPVAERFLRAIES